MPQSMKDEDQADVLLIRLQFLHLRTRVPLLMEAEFLRHLGIRTVFQKSVKFELIHHVQAIRDSNGQCPISVVMATLSLFFHIRLHLCFYHQFLPLTIHMFLSLMLIILGDTDLINKNPLREEHREAHD